MAVTLPSGFEIVRLSSLQHEKMVALIWLHKQNSNSVQEVAQITMENGFSRARIEFFTDSQEESHLLEFNLADFLEAIEAAKAILKDYDDEDTSHNP